MLVGRLGVERKQSEVAEGAEPVVHRHDDVALLGEPRRLYVGCGAVDPAAAVEPDQHRVFRARIAGGRIDIQVKTILVPTRRRSGAPEDRLLHTLVPRLNGGAHAGPGMRAQRWLPAQFPHRRLRIRDAFEEPVSRLPRAGEGSIRSLNQYLSRCGRSRAGRPSHPEDRGAPDHNSRGVQH